MRSEFHKDDSRRRSRTGTGGTIEKRAFGSRGDVVPSSSFASAGTACVTCTLASRIHLGFFAASRLLRPPPFFLTLPRKSTRRGAGSGAIVEASVLVDSTDSDLCEVVSAAGCFEATRSDGKDGSGSTGVGRAAGASVGGGAFGDDEDIWTPREDCWATSESDGTGSVVASLIMAVARRLLGRL